MPLALPRFANGSLRVRRRRSRGDVGGDDDDDGDSLHPSDSISMRGTGLEARTYGQPLIPAHWMRPALPPRRPDHGRGRREARATPPPEYTAVAAASEEVALEARKDDGDGYASVLFAFATGVVCAVGFMLYRPSTPPPPPPAVSLHDIAQSVAALRDEIASLRAALVTRA